MDAITARSVNEIRGYLRGLVGGGRPDRSLLQTFGTYCLRHEASLQAAPIDRVLRVIHTALAVGGENDSIRILLSSLIEGELKDPEFFQSAETDLQELTGLLEGLLVYESASVAVVQTLETTLSRAVFQRLRVEQPKLFVELYRFLEEDRLDCEKRLFQLRVASKRLLMRPTPLGRRVQTSIVARPHPQEVRFDREFRGPFHKEAFAFFGSFYVSLAELIHRLYSLDAILRAGGIEGAEKIIIGACTPMTEVAWLQRQLPQARFLHELDVFDALEDSLDLIQEQGPTLQDYLEFRTGDVESGVLGGGQS